MPPKTIRNEQYQQLWSPSTLRFAAEGARPQVAQSSEGRPTGDGLALSFVDKMACGSVAGGAVFS
ncbi:MULTISPECIES: hypothetical protein [Rhizobium]|uniref:hypothetical protein n=1 Tax=Rhizobium TaxID=379 RepID=UPI000AA4571C|nr:MULTISPECIES: hypothetical protein [Rhizobium]